MENYHTVSTQSDLPSTTEPFFTEIKPIITERTDRIFGWMMYLLAFGFVYTFSSEGMEWKLKLFTVTYACFVMAYFYFKKKPVAKEGYFWLIVLCGLGLSYSVDGIIIPLIQIAALIMVAAYFVLCVGGNLLDKGRSSQWILVDVCNTLWVVPFYNFICHLKVLRSTGNESKESRLRQLRSILLGFAITIPILVIAVPLLGSADQHFADLLLRLTGIFGEDILVFLFRVLFTLPVAAYLFGLIYGSIHKRNTTCFHKERIRKNMQDIRIVPNLAINTALMVQCLVYLLFIGLQGSYIFSALLGIRPETFTYAEYARRGFFELCQVAVLNLSVLLIANGCSRKMRRDSKMLRIMNTVLSALTILLIVTAMSKMILYMIAYGLTAKRVLTMVFMIWLLIVFGMMIVWQFKKIPLVRIALLTGTVFYTLLCVLPMMNWIQAFNMMFHY